MSKAKAILEALYKVENANTKVIQTKKPVVEAAPAPKVLVIKTAADMITALNEVAAKNDVKALKEGIMLIIGSLPPEMDMAGASEIEPDGSVEPAAESVMKWSFNVPKAQMAKCMEMLKAKLGEDAEVEPDGEETINVMSKEDVEQIVMMVLQDLGLVDSDDDQEDGADGDGEQDGNSADDMTGEGKAGKVMKHAKMKVKKAPKPAHPPTKAGMREGKSGLPAVFNQTVETNPQDHEAVLEKRSSGAGAMSLMNSFMRKSD